MSSYRRFISYMHQYTNGKKGSSCGFVKVELKNNICTTLFQLKNLPSTAPLTLAFFLPNKNHMTFVPIWSGTCPNGTFTKRFSLDSLHLFNTNYSFRQCSGIILSKNEEIICASCWDENQKVPKQFITSTSFDNDKPASNTNDCLSSTDQLPQKTHKETQQETQPKTQPKIQPKMQPKTQSKAQPKMQPQIPPQIQPKTPSNISASDDTYDTDSSVSKTPSFEKQWSNMQKNYPPLDPFEEGGIVEGIKISPSDLPILDCLPVDLGANRFLLHGYKNYKHLLLGRMEGQNRYILGIPGIYDSQEQFMAKAFGFPCFKPIRSCMKPNGQFGYWFRCIRS